MQQFVREFWHWLAVVPGVVFLVLYYLRWNQTYDTSPGHFLTGLIGVGSVLVCVVMLAFAPQYAYIFLPIGGIGLSTWLGYNYWYFEKYPIAMLREPSPPAPPHFIPKLKLLRYLARENTDEEEERESALFTRRFKTLAKVGICVFLVLFGFSRVVRIMVLSDKRVATAYKQGAASTSAAVSTAVSSATTAAVKAVYAVGDTLQAGNQLLAEKVDSTKTYSEASLKTSRANGENLKKQDQKVRNLKTTLDRRYPATPRPLKGQKIGLGTPTLPDTVPEPIRTEPVLISSKH